MRTLYFISGYVTLQFGVITFLTNPLDSMVLTILNFLAVAACYCLVAPFMKEQLQKHKNFDKFVSLVYQSNREHPLAQKFGTEVSKHMLEKEQYSSDKLKDIGAYISTDCFLSFLTLGIAVTPGLLITQFMF